MSFQILPRKDVDTEKWDACIHKSPYAPPYALSWYLDAATDKNWQALIQNDYEKVMPLPFKRRLLWKQVYQPPLSQQLGIYGANIKEKDVVSFLQYIPQRFAPLSIPMNASLNSVTIPGWLRTARKNYVLDLNQPYEQLNHQYDHGLKARIKKNAPKLTIESFNRVDELDANFRELIGSKIGVSRKQLDRAKSVLLAAYQHNHAFMIQVLATDNTWASRLYFLRMPNRIIKIRAIANKKGRKFCANHVGIDHVIQTYAEQDIIFDFEGSSIPGVAAFFKSFGSKLQPYHLYERKSWIRKAYAAIKNSP